MAGLTTAQQNAILEYLFTTDVPSVTRPTAWYVALHSGVPTDSAPETGEFTTTDFASYARQSVALSLVSGVVSNTADVTWTVDAGATPPAVVAFSIWDAATAGNCIVTNTVPTVTAAAGEVIRLVTGSITLTAD